MDDKHKDLLGLHRPKFVQCVDVERLIPFLQATEILSLLDVDEIRRQSSNGCKVDKLLDILQQKGSQAFQTLCLALETTYPHLLTVMFLGSDNRVAGWSTNASSVASDSEEDGIRHHPSLGFEESARIFSTPSPQSSASQEYDLQQNNLALLKAELKLVTSDRDTLRRELRKQTQAEKNAACFGKLNMSMDATSGINDNMASMNKQDVSNGDKVMNSSRDYEWLKNQCDKAMSELQALRKQHVDTVRKCDSAMKETDFYRNKHKLSLDKLDEQHHEFMIIRKQYNEQLADKHRLEQEVVTLRKFREEDRKEVTELRRQQQEAMNQSGNSEAVNQMYITAVQKYEAIKDDYDSLHKRYADLIASHSAAMSKLELTQEEVARLKKNYEEVCQERSAAIRERNGLKQQCTAAIRQWDNALRERNEIKEALAKVQQQKDEAMKEINQAIAVKIKATKDLSRLTEERNAAVQEYTLIMSERDSVHKEIEKLQEELSNFNKKMKTVEGQKKATLEEVEILRTEIASALHDRDKALKECNDVREKYGERVKDDSSHDEMRKDWEIRKLQRDVVGLKERVDDTLYTDEYGLSRRERMDNLDQANVEIDSLTKQIEKLQTELAEAQQESELSQKRRDWAFNERDKIVLERESMRTLCDKLRRERDRAVSDLAEALRDSDDIKKQRNEASKELKELREKIEAQLEKESRLKHLNSVSPNHSRDSAIDADMQEWETETLDFDLSGHVHGEDLGFELVGGKDDPLFPNDFSVYVSNISRGSVADGKLKVNDVVLKINEVEVNNVDRRAAFDAIGKSRDIVNMVVRRRKPTGSRYVQMIQLHVSAGAELGISVATGYYVTRIVPGGVTAREGSLAVGDRLISVNGRSLESMRSSGDVQKCLEENGDNLMVSVLKNSVSAPLSSSSSSHNMENLESVKSSSSPKSEKSSRHSDSGKEPDVAAADQVGDRHRICNLSPKISSPEAAGPKPLESQVVMQPSQVNNLLDGNGQNYVRVRNSSNISGLPPIAQPPNTLLDRAYQRIFREPRSKNGHMANPMSTQEAEATAALDSVIDHFSQPAELKVPKRRKKKEKEQAKTGGTWPKYKGPMIDFTDVGMATVRAPHKKKERKSIHSIASFPKQFSVTKVQQMDDGVVECRAGEIMPPTSERIRESYYLDYKHGHTPQSSDCSTVTGIRPKSPPYLSSPSYSSASPTSPMKNPANHDRFSATSSPSASIDYSVVSAQRNKEVMKFYKNKSKPRPKSAHYAMSCDGDFSIPMDSSSSNGHSKSIILDMSGKPLQSMQHDREPLLPSMEPIGLPPHLAHAQPQMFPKTTNPYVYSIPPSGIHPALIKTNIPSYSISRGQRYNHPHFPHSSMTSTSPPPASPRYSFPGGLSMYGSRSGDNINPSHGLHDSIDSRRFQRKELSGQYPINPSPSPSQYSYSTHSPTHSIDLPHFHQNYSKRPMTVHSHSPYREEVATYSLYDGMSTIPKRSHQRIRIPSNHSVTSKSSTGKISSSSIEKASTISDRGSPTPNFTVEMISSGSGGIQASSINDFRGKKLFPGDVRSIYIEKSSEPLGIQISCGTSGGIFVSSVGDNSLAAQAGIQIGDQLLEVCGINTRVATYQEAALVLRQCGDTITMLVQYNPDKYKERSDLDSCNSSGDTSPSQTPCSSPPNYHHHSSRVGSSNDDITTSANSTLTRQKVSSVGYDHSCHEPRFVFLKKTTSNLGISLVGGNAVGIFVHSLQKDSPAYGGNGLKTGDQILEYNGVDLRTATAEHAAYELAKPADTVTILAQYNISRYQDIQDQPGDSFYVKSLFEHCTDDGLSFHKDDILYVDNTMFNGVPGLWRAWLVDKEGHKLQCGLIPSKYKAEEELLMKRSMGDLDASDRRSSSSGRRSFFRRKKHQRSSSRDSKELASFSDVSINSFSDSGTLVEEVVPQTYCKVERLDSHVLRPVIIVGPLVEAVVDKLVQDFPNKFARCIPEVMRGSLQMMEKGLAELKFVDYRRRGSHFECTTVAAVREICERENCHCIMDVSLAAVERLHKCYIYPIVIFIKFKTTKQIREVKDSRFLVEKVTSKLAKEIYDHSLKLETEYKHLISAVIPGASLAYMCTQVKTCVDQEQDKMLWVPSGNT